MQTTYDRTPNRIRFTRTQRETMRDAGVLDGRYELIDGEIISKMGRNPPHSVTVIALCAWLISVFGALYVRSQTTIDVGDTDPEHNDPEPDVAVTIAPNSAFADHHPGSAELVLVAEVSDSTLRFDRTTKAAVYALIGIREYWIVDIAGRQVWVHREPQPERYAEVTAYSANERIATLTRPVDAVRVADLLPPSVAE